MRRWSDTYGLSEVAVVVERGREIRTSNNLQRLHQYMRGTRVAKFERQAVWVVRRERKRRE
ncbi:hypothetical protein E2C01_102420 [Portunus trituberculatus]|uniref:Uncharacterized protein n=1 Tax=Portunus trituberculatus TaxID=210409 RepID=A0A5B7KH96_PORTR|nr:hypothetical protein [Portunus trituberculatus]